MPNKNSPKPTPLPKLAKLRLALLYSCPAALFCSYFPLIPLVSTPSTNYELSLSLIWLFLFSVLSLKDAFHYIYNIYSAFRADHSPKRLLPLSLIFFPLYLALSALWSANPLRAILTAGIFCCLLISAIGVLSLAQAKAFSSRKFLKTFLLTSCAFSILCWFQTLLDIFGVDRSITLLCAGCTSYSFGFPHPSGLAIEPQFMGNLLLAPTFLALHYFAQPKSHSSAPLCHSSIAFVAFLLTSTLFLTFSRGAIYSFAVAFLLLVALSFVRLKQRSWLKTIPLVVISFFFTLFMQGFFSAISYTDSTFASGLEKSLSQLSLGQINLQLSPATDSSTIDSPSPASSDFAPAIPSRPTPAFSGYVEESTDVRINFNRIALDLSTKSPTKLLFGFGLGSAGTVMYQEGKTATPYEIVQNEYLSLLLETGLVGLLLALAALLATLLPLKTLLAPARYLSGAIILAFLLSLLFFSGLPNALHVYLFPVFIVACFLPKHKPIIN